MNQSKVSALKLFQPALLCPDPREMPFSEVSIPFLDTKYTFLYTFITSWPGNMIE
jgi:hypothetical protein